MEHSKYLNYLSRVKPEVIIHFLKEFNSEKQGALMYNPKLSCGAAIILMSLLLKKDK
jgi:hypothetical protein